MNVVIYARYSSHAQREESIEGQIRKCSEYAERNGMRIVGEYIDRAISGKTDKRKDFQRLMRDSEKGVFQGVLMYTLDRFARNRYDSAMYKARLKKNGVKVFYAVQDIPDSPEGIILESVLEGYAEYYSENLSRGVKRGMKENALQCKITGGYMPLGFKKTVDKKYEVDEDTAPIVRRIFRLYADGNTIKRIVDTLNEEGYKTVKGLPFKIASLQTLLYNRKYIGEYSFDDVTVENGIPAIVDKELFEKVQGMLKKNKRCTGRMKAHEEYLLTTKLFCGKCGGVMVGESGTSQTGTIYNYYKCTCRKKQKACDKKVEKKEWIERFAVQQTIEKLFHPEVIDSIAQRMSDILEAEYNDTSRLVQLESELEETQKSIKNLLRMVEKGIDTEDVGSRLVELNNDKNELLRLVGAEQNKKPPVTRERLAFWLSSFLSEGSVDDIDYQRRIIDTLVNSIFVFDTDDGGRDIVFTFNISQNSTYKVHLSDIKSSDICCFGRPQTNNPNIVSIGDGFGFLLFIDYPNYNCKSKKPMKTNGNN